MTQQDKILHPAHTPFDGVAEDYDLTFSRTLIGRLQRKRVYSLLEKTLAKQSLKILEINCGSGEDAIWLASKGHYLLATDASEKMIGLVHAKIRKHHFKTHIIAKQAAFSELKNNFALQSFDLVFSNFGGLNCISKKEIETLRDDISTLLKPDGKFIAVIMGKKCLWERFYFLAKGKFREAMRRNTNQPVKVKLGDALQPVWYYSPSQIRSIFFREFVTKKLKPVGMLVPPSYLNPFFSKKKFPLKILNKLDRIVSFSLLSNYADHFYIELQKIK